MNPTGQRIILAIAALWGLAGVVMLASGSHPPQTGILAIGGQFLLFHAVAVIAILSTSLISGWRRALPMALMLTGSGLFAFEIIIHATTGVVLPALAPIGGGVAILGWLALVIAPLMSSK
ncbi:MAG: hypothetical protein QM647_11925 [Asticcacaulis sp.]|uniref:DUF423 domain-containing protein n=1 Tax=Asticcacaulis sp. TaxID=1872648 RepID=UPI0039E33871